MPAHNIWNDTALCGWIAGFAHGNGRTAKLLILALEKPLRAHAQALKRLESLPPDAPGWLKDKFGRAAFHEFDPSLDPGLDAKIDHIRDWIAGAVASEEPWTKEEKPKRLLHFKTVDDAMEAADKAMKEDALRLRERFKDNAIADDGETQTVMTLPGGFRIVRLLTPQALDRESAEMGHCIGNGGYDEKLRDDRYAYYFLRDAADRPHATFEVEGKTLLQCKGKQNVPPEEKYFPAVRAFVEREKFLLKENPGHTGLWQAPDGAYHSVRRLPKGVKIRGNLDLSSLRDVTLPEDLSVWGQLTINGADPPELPKKLKVIGIVYQCRNGKYHREDGPALIMRNFETGIVTCELWYKNDQSHREDGPTVIQRDWETGAVISEAWHRNGRPHRENGPAWTKYDPKTGVVIHEQWYMNGRQISPPVPDSEKAPHRNIRP